MGYREMFAVRASGMTDRTQVDVLEALAFFQNSKTGICFPSTDALARVSRVNANLVRKTIRALEECGLVSCSQEPGRPRYFELHLENLPQGVDINTPLDESEPLEDPQPLNVHTSHPFRKVEGTPLGKLHEPLEDPQPEQGIEQGNKQGSKDFYVETPVSSNRSLFPDEVAEPVARYASRYPDCPYKELLALYHEKLPMLPTVMTLTPARKAQLKARWNQVYREEECASKEQCMEVFGLIFDRISNSRFLTGATNPGPGRERPFRATFDWIVKESNFVKICENRYA